MAATNGGTRASLGGSFPTLLGLQIREALAALWAFPKPIAFVFRVNLSEVHGRPIVRTTNARPRTLFNPVPFLGGDEVPAGGVVNKTVPHRADIRDRSLVIRHHLGEMLVAKRLYFLSRLHGEHRTLLGAGVTVGEILRPTIRSSRGLVDTCPQEITLAGIEVFR